jgi:RNA polymerase sigma-70 factor (ECF subfamily)
VAETSGSRFETDADLIRRFLDGDEGAFEVLVKRHQKSIYNLAYRITGDQASAADLTQEVFIRALRKISTFKGQATFKTWLYRLAINLCRDFIRRERRLALFTGLALFNNLPFKRSIENDPVELVERAEAKELVQEALLKLSFDFRAVVILCDIQGYSYQEAAETLGLPLGTVKSRLNRARQQLTSLLRPYWNKLKAGDI